MFKSTIVKIDMFDISFVSGRILIWMSMKIELKIDSAINTKRGELSLRVAQRNSPLIDV